MICLCSFFLSFLQNHQRQRSIMSGISSMRYFSSNMGVMQISLLPRFLKWWNQTVWMYVLGSCFCEFYGLDLYSVERLVTTNAFRALIDNFCFCSVQNAPTQSLLSVVNGILDESIERKNGEIPQVILMSPSIIILFSCTWQSTRFNSSLWILFDSEWQAFWGKLYKRLSGEYLLKGNTWKR